MQPGADALRRSPWTARPLKSGYPKEQSMIRQAKYIIIPLILLAHLPGSMPQIGAQNMKHTVVERRVKFAPGKTKAILRGKANYAMSYVYLVGARKDQTMEVHLNSKGSLAKFSITAPKATESIEGAFLVSDWTGKLPESGDYTIVVVMNEEKAANVAYTLEVAIK
jgi:hypothetical protein